MQPLAFRKPSPMLANLNTNRIFFTTLHIFSNPLVPCDAITIPLINLAPWKEGYGPVQVSAPLRRPQSPDPAPSTSVSPYNFHHSPVFTSGYSPAPGPAPYSPVSVLTRGRGSRYSNSHSKYNNIYNTLQTTKQERKVKPFVHSGYSAPLHRFNLNVKYRKY